MSLAPSTVDLAEAVERNFIESWLLLARLDPQTELVDTDGVRGFISGSSSPLLNGIVDTRIPADRDRNAVIDAVLDRFDRKGLSATWWALPSAEPADLRQRLSARGLVYGGSMPGMALDLGAPNLAAPNLAAPQPGGGVGGAAADNFVIDPVETDTALAAFLSVAVPALDAPDDFGAIFARTVHADGFGAQRFVRNYVGRIGGLPVATSSLITVSRTAGIYNVATAAGYRRRGLGRAMTLAALGDARRLGLRIAVLQSTELGHPVYAALGFRDVCTIHLHVLDAPHESTR